MASAVELLELPRWSWWALLLLALLPIFLINVTVAWVGRSSVFPLSPFFLGYKIDALKAYAWHRPRCVFFADQPITAPLLASAEQRAPSALRVPGGDRAGRVRRTAPPDLVRRRDGADAADPAHGAPRWA